MKKPTSLRVLKISAITIVLLAAPFFVYKALDEKLTPEAQSFFAENAELQRKIRDTTTRLDLLKIEDLKTLPENTVCPTNTAPLPLEKWQQIKNEKTELVQKALEIGSGPALLLSQDNLWTYGSQIVKLRPLFKVSENEACSLEMSGKPNDALELYYRLAKTAWDSSTNPNGHLATFVFLAVHTFALNHINEIEKRHPELAKTNLRAQLQENYKKINLNEFMLMQAKADAHITVNSANPSFYFRSGEYLTAFFFWYSHLNAAKNEMVDKIPSFLSNQDPDHEIVKALYLSQLDAKTSLVKMLEIRLVATKLRHTEKFKNLAQLLDVEPVKF